MAIVIFICSIVLPSQSNAQSLNNLQDINEVWYKFYEAFSSLDYKPMAEIHSKRLVRISGGQRILDYDTYIDNYKSMFSQAKLANETNKISLRFFERISNDSVASERGIYKLTRNGGQPTEQNYYGQFHVIMIKEDGGWKILMDYDSSEGNSIGEPDFSKSHEITEYDKFK